ncbi:MAG: hypothetical protein ABJN22_08050 [Litorimonas sp.]
MRKILTLISATALLATPAIAQARGFEADFSQAVTGPFKLEVVVSEDLAHRANNLPKKLSDRGSSSRLNSPFSNNGKYGDQAIEHLLQEMQEELVEDFQKRGLTLSDSAPTLLRVTINEVKNNRPTFNQLKEESNLSFKSFGIGGADVSAEFIAAGGAIVGTAEYDYFSSFNDRPVQSSGTWTDADRAFSRFSKKLSKKLASMDTGSS